MSAGLAAYRDIAWESPVLLGFTDTHGHRPLLGLSPPTYQGGKKWGLFKLPEVTAVHPFPRCYPLLWGWLTIIGLEYPHPRFLDGHCSLPRVSCPSLKVLGDYSAPEGKGCMHICSGVGLRVCTVVLSPSSFVLVYCGCRGEH